MRKNKILRATGLAAPVALTIALAAPLASADMMEHFWEAKGNQGWVNSYGECWQSKDGPTDIPPCAAPVPEEVTLRLEFEFDKYEMENVVNREEVAKIDNYVEQVQATPTTEYVTVSGHTDAKGSDEYNMALGQRRADTVRDYIISRGYPAENVAPSVSRGEQELLPEYSPFALEQRRVVLTKTDS